MLLCTSLAKAPRQMPNRRVLTPAAEWLGGYDNVWALFGLGADAVDKVQDFQVAAE